MLPLLTEYNLVTTAAPILREQYEKTGHLIISGLMQRADSVNQNKRVYPKDILMREANKFMRLISEDRAVGELDHPESVIVNLANVSHIIREMWWSGNDLMGKVEVLCNTDAGKILKELLLAGVKVGISSRGVGSVKEEVGEEPDDKRLLVQDDFDLITFDIVSNPSTQGAFMLKEHQEKVNPKLNKLINIDRIMSDILLNR